MPSRSSTPDLHLPLKKVDFLVLAMLEDGPLHGYGLVKAIAARTGDRVRIRPGDLYRVLYRLSGQGLVDAEAPASAAERNRIAYRLTAHGRRVLRDEARMLAAVAGSVLARPADEMPETS